MKPSSNRTHAVRDGTRTRYIDVEVRGPRERAKGKMAASSCGEGPQYHVGKLSISGQSATRRRSARF